MRRINIPEGADGIQEVSGSILLISTNKPSKPKGFGGFSFSRKTARVGSNYWRQCLCVLQPSALNSLACRFVRNKSRYVFYCTGLKEIYILDTVISIETDAFTNCHSFKTINLTDGLTKICRNTFDGCISIKTITNPDTITKIAKETFSNY